MNSHDVEPRFIAPKRLEAQARDELGRYIVEERPEPHPDECLSGEEVVLALRKLYYQAVKDSKAALARACGLKDRQRLLGIIKGRSHLEDAVRRRCSRFLMQVSRGEMILVHLGRAPRSPNSMYAWKRGSDGSGRNFPRSRALPGNSRPRF